MVTLLMDATTIVISKEKIDDKAHMAQDNSSSNPVVHMVTTNTKLGDLETWYLTFECFNHMTNDKERLVDFDDTKKSIRRVKRCWEHDDLKERWKDPLAQNKTFQVQINVVEYQCLTIEVTLENVCNNCLISKQPRNSFNSYIPMRTTYLLKMDLVKCCKSILSRPNQKCFKFSRVSNFSLRSNLKGKSKYSRLAKGIDIQHEVIASFTP
ncbi:hypothetical protein CR513_61294, partial [Mucuna pruriens]